MKNLRIDSKTLKDGVELLLTGELIFGNSQEFMRNVPERVLGKGKNVVINIEKLEFIDSSGLGAILYASQACKLQNQHVNIINANPNLLHVLRTIKKVGTFSMQEQKE